MNGRLELFYIRLRVEYKTKNWLTGKIKEHNQILDVDHICVARSIDEACEKYKARYDIEKVKEYGKNKVGGYDHKFFINAYNTDWISMDRLEKELSVQDCIDYISQFRLNKNYKRPRR